MRKICRIASWLLAACLALSVLLLALPVKADYVPKNMAEIIGIDYDRITQKTFGGKKSYPVELKLGSVTFSGELYGEYGLSYEELNQIIYQTLADKNLTIDRIQTVGKIAAQVESEAARYWTDQVVEGVLSYLPIPLSLNSVGDYYVKVVHGETDPAVKSAIFSASKKAANAAIQRAARLGGKVGLVGRVASRVASLPGLGAVVNTAMVGSSWMDGSERFNKFQKLLEDNLAVINDFYSTCSQRAAKLVEDKDGQNTWKVRFDKRKNYRTYNCTFWGISGNMMSCTLSGELTSRDNEMIGSYTGTLWLELEAVDFSPLEANVEKTSGISPVISVLYSTGGYRKTSDSGSKTVLKVESQGTLTFYLSSSEGTVRPNVVGSLGADKEVEFSFNRHLVWRDDTWAAYGSYGETEATLNSTSLNSVHMSTFSRAYNNKGGEESRQSSETYPQDPGNVLSPLESDPVLTVYFSK